MGCVLLVRHGSTALNAGGESDERVRGWNDIPLNAEGRAEAQRIAHDLSNKSITRVYTSPLIRARDTAEAICKHTGAELHLSICLLPWQLGYMQGEPVKKIIPEMNWYVEHPSTPVPQGEQFDQYRMRFLPFLLRKVTEAQALPEDDIIVLVTHSRGLQITKAWVANGSPDSCEISAERMLDYKDETGTGGTMKLSAQ